MGCRGSKVKISGSTSNLEKQPPGSYSQGTTEQPPTSQPPQEDESQYVEGVVCQETDLNENEMKSFELGDEGNVLLIKQHGKIHALGNKCTHYKAPLEKGALADGKIRCQWHGACFNIETGDIEDFPGMDSLPCYKVTIDPQGGVKVRAKKTELSDSRRTNTKIAKCDVQTKAMKVVVVGGGPSGAVCVQKLRENGFTGDITLICKESYLPYDRVKVSKAMDSAIDKIILKNEDFYNEASIKVLLNTEVTALDAANKKLLTKDGASLPFDKVYIATGCRPRRPQDNGFEMKNVFTVREYDDAVAIKGQLAEDKEIVVLGGSFISMESASYCVTKVKKVTVVIKDAEPFEQSLGTQVGAALRKLFEEKGVNFVLNSGIKKTSGSGKIEAVELVDGTILKADILILGLGSHFNTEFLKDSGLNMTNFGAIEVDEYLESNIKDVFVGGDIAYAPVWSWGGKKDTIGHFPLAQYHGMIAACNILNQKKKMEVVPFFWTMLFGKSIRYSGHGEYDEIIFDGSVDELKFAAFYIKSDVVVAMSSCGRDPVVSNFANYLALGKTLRKEQVQNEATRFDWISETLPA